MTAHLKADQRLHDWLETVSQTRKFPDQGHQPKRSDILDGLEDSYVMQELKSLIIKKHGGQDPEGVEGFDIHSPISSYLTEDEINACAKRARRKFLKDYPKGERAE